MESDDFDKELLSAPETLRELVKKYKQRKLSFDKQHKTLHFYFWPFSIQYIYICNGCNFSNCSVYTNKSHI